MKRKTKLISFLLILTLSFGCIIAPYYGQQIYVKAIENESDEEFEQLVNSYLTGNDISDDYIYEQEEAVYQQYSEYVAFDNENAGNRKLIISETPIEEKYGATIFDESVDISETVENDDDAHDIAVVRLIHENINAMNELVDAGIGHINDRGEFIVDVTDDSIARFRLYNFYLKWNSLSFYCDEQMAIVFAGVFLIARMVVGNRQTKLTNAMTTLQTQPEKVSRAISDVLDELPNDIINKMIAFFSDDVFSYVINLCSTFSTLLGTTTPLGLILLAVKYILPSYLDCIIVLYKSIKYGNGMELKACWIPTWWDKFGVSIKSI